MADFEKVRMGHERWTAQWPAVRTHAGRLRHEPIAWGRGP